MVLDRTTVTNCSLLDIGIPFASVLVKGPKYQLFLSYGLRLPAIAAYWEALLGFLNYDLTLWGLHPVFYLSVLIYCCSDADSTRRVGSSLSASRFRSQLCVPFAYIFLCTCIRCCSLRRSAPRIHCSPRRLEFPRECKLPVSLVWIGPNWH